MRAKPASAPPPSFDPDAPAWPQVVELLGIEHATSLSKELGGRRIYVPREAGAHHPIVEAVGPEAAGKLCDFMAGQNLAPPMAAGKRARILELLGQGMQKAKVARIVGCTERQVYRVQAEVAAERQPDLFS